MITCVKQRITAQQPGCRECRPFCGAVHLQRLERVLRAGRQVPTRRRAFERREYPPIKSHERQQSSQSQRTAHARAIARACPECRRNGVACPHHLPASTSCRAIRARSSRIAAPGAAAALSRAMNTTSRPAGTQPCVRSHSLICRRIRFRVTALPTFLVTVKPARPVALGAEATLRTTAHRCRPCTLTPSP